MLKIISLFVALFCISSAHTHGICSTASKTPCSPFKLAFNDALSRSEDLLQQFYVQFPPTIAFHVFYKLALSFYSKFDTPNSAGIARDIAEAAQCKVEYVTPEEFAELCANATEHILKTIGILNKKNATSLALKYVFYLDQARLAIKGDRTARKNLKSLFDAGYNLFMATASTEEDVGEIIYEAFVSGLKALPCHCPE